MAHCLLRFVQLKKYRQWHVILGEVWSCVPCMFYDLLAGVKVFNLPTVFIPSPEPSRQGKTLTFLCPLAQCMVKINYFTNSITGAVFHVCSKFLGGVKVFNLPTVFIPPPSLNSHDRAEIQTFLGLFVKFIAQILILP